MRMFLAGATGAIGKRLVALLVAAGHHVIATTRTPDKVNMLRAQGAEPVIVDSLDRDAVMKAVVSSHPAAIVHQMAALASMRSLKDFDTQFAVTNRLRTEGTSHLLEAAHACGTQKFVAQSYTGWPNERQGGRIKTEEDPLDSDPPKTMTKTLNAIRALEDMVVNASGFIGIALRYGSLYGPGTSFSDASSGAKPPLHLPVWIGRFLVGEAGVSMMNEIRGSSNAKAKGALGWQLDYPSWRGGFRRGLLADDKSPKQIVKEGSA